jgi:mannose-6-phosphate isomerase-like protein (cupin superfamily)
MDKIDLSQVYAGLGASRPSEPIVSVNASRIRLVRPVGAGQWDRHPHDEFALVLKGRLRVKMRDREVVLDPGQGLLVARGTEHQATAEGDTQLLLVEPDPAA